MKRIDRLAPWLIGAFVLTVAVAAIYFTAQNLERAGADDAAQRLASQVLTESPTEPARVDLATSLAPFWIVYSKDGTATDGNGYLDGSRAELPAGVIRAAVADGTNRVSWQPRDGLRFATVAVRDGNRVIVAGQSLAPSESRTDALGLLLLIGWAVALLALAIGCAAHLRAGRDFG